MIFIHGIGHFHPENVIDNQFLEDLNIETTNTWITDRVGIKQRRTVLDLDYIKTTYNEEPKSIGEHIKYTNAQTGAMAARQALAKANLSPQDIGMVIAGGSLAQYSLPAEACTIAAELGISAPAFDINSACSTFAVQMHTIHSMQAESLPDHILLVISENMTRSVNFKDRRVAVLWGDGAVAIVVSKKIKTKISVSYTTISSNPASWATVVVPAGGHFYQDGHAVQKFAIKKTVATIEKLRQEQNIADDQHYFIGHQANLVMLRSVCRLAKIDETKHIYNVDEYGNCGAAGAPSVWSQNWHKFVAGDTILLVVVGAGLTWGGMVIKYED